MGLPSIKKNIQILGARLNSKERCLPFETSLNFWSWWALPPSYDLKEETATDPRQHNALVARVACQHQVLISLLQYRACHATGAALEGFPEKFITCSCYASCSLHKPPKTIVCWAQCCRFSRISKSPSRGVSSRDQSRCAVKTLVHIHERKAAAATKRVIATS